MARGSRQDLATRYPGSGGDEILYGRVRARGSHATGNGDDLLAAFGDKTSSLQLPYGMLTVKPSSEALARMLMADPSRSSAFWPHGLPEKFHQTLALKVRISFDRFALIAGNPGLEPDEHLGCAEQMATEYLASSGFPWISAKNRQGVPVGLNTLIEKDMEIIRVDFLALPEDQDLGRWGIDRME